MLSITMEFAVIPREVCMFFFLMIRRPPRSTLFPYTTLFRSLEDETSYPPEPGKRIGETTTDVGRGMATLPLLAGAPNTDWRSEEHTSELQSRQYLVCRLLLEKKKKKINTKTTSQIKRRLRHC